MQNIEKYSKELAEIAAKSERIAVNKNTGVPCGCSEIECDKCMFDSSSEFCPKLRETWAHSEYQETPKRGMLNADEYENLREVISAHIDRVYEYCGCTNCASCPYNHSVNCRELLLFESLFLGGWKLSRDTVDIQETFDVGHIVLNKESYCKL